MRAGSSRPEMATPRSCRRALPPRLTYTKELVLALSRADAALGELSGVGGELPDPQLLDAPFKRQEALCSSRIEGAEVTLSDLLLDQVSAARPERPARAPARGARLRRDAALRRRAARGDALSLEFMRALHERLLRGEVGDLATPGEFRTSQNWIGPPGATLATATYVPPPVPELHAGARGLRRLPAGARAAARPRAVRHAARAVRDHPSVRRRQRPSRPAAHHAVPHRAAAPHAPAAVSLGLPRGAPRRVLRAAPARAHPRRVGAVADLLRQRRARDGRARDAAGARAHPSPRARPREGQGTRADARRRAVPHAVHDGARGAARARRRQARTRARRRELEARGLLVEWAEKRWPRVYLARHVLDAVLHPLEDLRSRPEAVVQGAALKSGPPPIGMPAAARRPPDDRGHGHRSTPRGSTARSFASPAVSPSGATASISTSWTASTRTSTSSGSPSRRGSSTRSSRASATRRTATSPSPPTPASCSTSRPRR